VIVTVVWPATAEVVAVKVLLVCPAAIVMLEGICATVASLDIRDTVAPPDEAAPDKATVTVVEMPPMTLLGATVRDDSLTG
jgi:hypothetical protein